MKWRVILLPPLLLSSGLLVSCAVAPGVVDDRPRFHDAAAANVVLRHYRWEHINIIQPPYREEGFLVSLNRDTMGAAIDRLGPQRQLAVVILGAGYADQDLCLLVAAWRDLLRSQGFQRVICLLAGSSDQVNGLLILDDTRHPHATSRETAGS